MRLQASDLGRDLGKDRRQALGLVVGRDADEDAAPAGADLGRLDLGGRQRPHEPADPLVGSIGAGERVEQQQVRDGDRHDEDGHQATERLALQAEPVLDGANEVGNDGDGQETKPDEQQAERRDSAPGPAPSQPSHRHEDHHDREGDADEAQQTDGHVPSV